MTDSTDKKPLTAAQIEQRREAGRKGGSAPKSGYTMTPDALAQRREASALSTGPVTEDGKAASSRNAMKTGEYSAVAKFEAWQRVGIHTKPCKSTCPKHPSQTPAYPCMAAVEGMTKPGGDCKDMQVYVDAFEAIQASLLDGKNESAYAMLAHMAAGSMQMTHQLWEVILTHGALIEQPVLNRKTGEPVYHPVTKELITVKEVHPLLMPYIKKLGVDQVNMPEMLLTPRAVKKAETDKDGADALQQFMDGVARIGRAAPRPRTLDVTPQQVDEDDAA